MRLNFLQSFIFGGALVSASALCFVADPCLVLFLNLSYKEGYTTYSPPEEAESYFEYRLLGKGNFGRVFRKVDTRNGQSEVIKIYKDKKIFENDQAAIKLLTDL